MTSRWLSLRRLAIAVCSALIGIGSLATPAAAAGTVGDATCDLTGSGTAASPYQVGTASDVAEINDCNDGSTFKYYEQTATIDLTPSTDGSLDGWNDNSGTAGTKSDGKGWVPIGDFAGNSSAFPNRVFTGDYNGQGWHITKVTVSRNSSYQGLFGKVSNATVHDLTIDSSSVTGLDYVGGLAGQIENSNIDNVTVVSATVAGSRNESGGLSGNINNANITHVVIQSVLLRNPGIRAVSQVGGLVGYVTNSNITHVTVSGDMYGDWIKDDKTAQFSGSDVGGLAGYAYYSNIARVAVTANVFGEFSVGGICGSCNAGSLKHSTFSGAVTGARDVISSRVYSLGGAAGYFEEGALDDVTVDATVVVDHPTKGDAVGYIGGFVGGADYVSMTRDSVTGSVSVSINGTNGNSVAGFAGYAESGSVIDGATIDVDIETKGASTVGGVAGYAGLGFKVIDTVYHGQISADQSDVGGICGYCESGTTIERTGVSAGSVVSASNSGGTATAVGGVIGSANSGTRIHQVYNRADVSGDDRVGGVIGERGSNSVVISETYSTGTVSASAADPSSDVFAPASAFTATDDSNTFDTDTTGSATSASGVMGHPTSDMKTAATFTAMGWSLGADDSIWQLDPSVNDGYPSFRPAAVVSAAGGPTNVGTVRFASGSRRLRSTAKQNLVAAATAIKAGSYSKVTVRVYTTSHRTGLAMARARVIARYLRLQGVTVRITRQATTIHSRRLNNTAAIFATSA